MRRRTAVIAFLALSCTDRAATQRPVEERTTLAGGIAARVGGEPISVELVAAVATEQAVTPENAVRRLIDDAIAAQAARMRRLDRVPPARWLLTSVRARLVADKLREQAVAKGPPTKQEVDDLTLLHWQQVDRDVSVRVVHAVIFGPDDAAMAAAKEEAATLRERLLDTATPQEFLDKGNAFKVPEPLKIVVQELPPFIEEGGWVTVGNDQRMDQRFATAAHALAKPGDTSGVVRSGFGWHVIRLVERIPASKMSYEARRAAFTEEAHANRARKEIDALLAQLRAKHPVVVSTSAETLMRSVHAEPEQPSAGK
jgi:peptidyl-prolyl cis-trans isomerase C